MRNPLFSHAFSGLYLVSYKNLAKPLETACIRAAPMGIYAERACIVLQAVVWTETDSRRPQTRGFGRPDDVTWVGFALWPDIEQIEMGAVAHSKFDGCEALGLEKQRGRG